MTSSETVFSGPCGVGAVQPIDSDTITPVFFTGFSPTAQHCVEVGHEIAFSCSVCPGRICTRPGTPFVTSTTAPRDVDPVPAVAADAGPELPTASQVLAELHAIAWRLTALDPWMWTRCSGEPEWICTTTAWSLTGPPLPTLNAPRPTATHCEVPGHAIPVKVAVAGGTTRKGPARNPLYEKVTPLSFPLDVDAIVPHDPGPEQSMPLTDVVPGTVKTAVGSRRDGARSRGNARRRSRRNANRRWCRRPTCRALSARWRGCRSSGPRRRRGRHRRRRRRKRRRFGTRRPSTPLRRERGGGLPACPS